MPIFAAACSMSGSMSVQGGVLPVDEQDAGALRSVAEAVLVRVVLGLLHFFLGLLDVARVVLVPYGA